MQVVLWNLLWKFPSLPLYGEVVINRDAAICPGWEYVTGENA